MKRNQGCVIFLINSAYFDQQNWYLKLECHKVMQNYLLALSYLHMAHPQAVFTHLKCWWNVREYIEKGVLFLKSLIL